MTNQTGWSFCNRDRSPWKAGARETGFKCTLSCIQSVFIHTWRNCCDPLYQCHHISHQKEMMREYVKETKKRLSCFLLNYKKKATSCSVFIFLFFTNLKCLLYFNQNKAIFKSFGIIILLTLVGLRRQIFHSFVLSYRITW